VVLYLCVVEALETLVEGLGALTVRVAVALALQAAVSAHISKVALALVRFSAPSVHAPLWTHRHATPTQPEKFMKKTFINFSNPTTDLQNAKLEKGTFSLLKK
jgi:hypothetical protein